MELMENVLTAGEAPKLKLTAGIRKYQNIILLAGLSVLIARFNCLGGLSPLILPFVLACQSNLFIFAGAITGLLLTPEINCFKYALMIFCLLYTPCAATIATIKRETHSWKWTCGMMAFQLIVAWVAAVAVYQVGSRLF